MWPMKRAANLIDIRKAFMHSYMIRTVCLIGNRMRITGGLIFSTLIFLAAGNVTALASNVTVTGLVAADKIYDGGTNTTLNFSSATLVGVSSGDTANVFLVTNTYSASFADKNVGPGKTVTIANLALGGTAAGNYTLIQPVLSASITLRDLGISASANDKTYDGNSNAVVNVNLINAVADDDLIAFYDTASFSDKNVGTGKTVTVYDLFVLGTDSDNYNLTNATAVTTASIGARTLHVGAVGQNKPYDGTTNATATLVDNHLSGDVVTESYASAFFTDPSVGNSKTINVSGIAISGGKDGGNYSLGNTTSTARGNITARTLTVTASGQNKSYDGTVNASVSLSDNHISGDDITVDYTTASFADKNAGTNKTVTVSGLFITGGAAGSYTLTNTSVTTTANISSGSLTVSATGVNKTYDGTTNATVTLGDNRVSGDNLTTAYVGASFADKNVGGGKTVTATGISISGPDAVNYALANTTASTHANITSRSISVSANGQNKVYDRTTSATVTLTDNGIAGDSLVDSRVSATFGDKAVGNGKTVTVTGIQVTGPDSGNYTLTNTTATTTANITSLPLAVTAAGQDKAYDGTTNASVTLSDTHLSGDSVNDSYVSAGFNDKNVGTGKTVTVLGIQISGGDSGNYTLTNTTATTTANITGRTLSVVATGQNKMYDGTTNASVTLSDNHLPGDLVTNSYASAGFADKNVGTGKTVTVTGIGITGPDASNYSLASSTASTHADITSRNLTINATGQDKVYDGTTNASVTIADNHLSGDLVTDSYGRASFSDKSVGTGKTVTVVGIQISGGDSGNYALTNATATTTANITGRPLSVVATGQNKVYDGATNATVTLSDNHLSGDVVNDSYASAGFADKNAGSGKLIVVFGISINGNDAGNYSLSASNATCTANITVRPLAVTATGINKPYDGTVSATVTLGDNRVSGDAVTDGYGSASFTTSSVGNGKTVNVSGIYITGTGAGNYNLTNSTAVTTANITATGPATTLSSSSNPSGYRAPITFTETLPADATGTVSLYTNGTVIASGAVSAGAYFSGSISNLFRGTNLVTAIYGGDGNYASATNTLFQVVTNHPPVTGFFSFSVTNGLALRVRISSLLSAVVDQDNDPTTLVSVGTSTNGVVPATNATFIQFRNPRYLNDQFSYVVTDGFGGYATGQVQVASVVQPFTGQPTTINPSGNSASLTFYGIPNYTYLVQRSVNLVTWKSIATNTALPNGVIQITDHFSDLGSTPGSAFYQLVWVPVP